ncbi:MAG: endonuclease, partial [Bacteroidales bacterium]|nr:endonuclease [Bacteroidales bacterium]
MKQHLAQGLLLAAFLLVTTALQAQIPNGYYNNADGKTGDELKVALHNIINGHSVKSYSSLNDIYAYTDCDSDGKIWDIYSNKRWSLSNDCGSYDSEGDCWNKEHTWPQSWFNEKSGPKSDLFHVMPTDGYVNNRRSNYPYGEVSHATWTSSNGSKLGRCTTSGYSGTVFEPVDEYKGDIARNFFYMSVRYYNEDSGWGSSGMTNKSEIKDWAMTMLLRWSDEDPVSDKEIARNNAVYGYQNNRNPFIDHPEYARMIWDPNWTAATSYDITCATGLQNGSVSAPTSAPEGSTVAITATPEAGYMVDAYSVYKTGSPNTTVTVSSNGTFTMPGYDVTVSATFTVNNTYYDIALSTVSHGTINASATSARSGTNITLAATPDNGYSLYAWYVYKTGDMNTTVPVTNNSFVMPAYNVTVQASFVQGEVGNGDYVKVTTAPTDWSGEYLIVYEEGGVAFNGGLTTLDASSNTIGVTINDNTIEANETTNAATFTIATSGNAYTIRSASGYYIGRTSNDNGLNASTSSAYTNNISFNNGSIDIIGSGGAYLRYNQQSGQERFRYFKSSTYNSQQPIQLYKKASSTTVPTHSIHFDGNGGTGQMSDQTVNEFEATVLNANTFTREDFEFDGWNTEANGTGTYYTDGAMITLTDDITLYAQWDPKYSITLVQPQHGTITASVSSAVQDATVTLTAAPEEGYELRNWTVTTGNGNTLEVVENQFEMPADQVTVTASFRYVGVAQVSYQLVTSIDQLVPGEKYLIVNVEESNALGTTQNNNNRSAESVSSTDHVINTISAAVCELELGGATDAWTFFDAGWSANGGYLYAASSSNNYLRTQATNNANGQWSISIASTGVATITAQGTNTRNTIKYNPNTNNGSPIFSCYASGQEDICLFRRVETFPAVEQTVTLNKGWNWWSTNLDVTLEQLETALAGKATSITSQNDGFVNYVSALGWTGSLNTLSPA